MANSIFGFDGWSSQIVDITPDFIEELKGGKTWRVGVTAVVKVMLKDGTFHEDVGYGISENPSKGTPDFFLLDSQFQVLPLKIQKKRLFLMQENVLSVSLEMHWVIVSMTKIISRK